MIMLRLKIQYAGVTLFEVGYLVPSTMFYINTSAPINLVFSITPSSIVTSSKYCDYCITPRG